MSHIRDIEVTLVSKALSLGQVIKLSKIESYPDKLNYLQSVLNKAMSRVVAIEDVIDMYRGAYTNNP